MRSRGTRWGTTLGQTRGVLIILGVFAALSLLAVLLIYRHEFGPDVLHNRAYWGQFGDFVGGLLNPIFGFLGFAAILATLYYQRREYDEQKEIVVRQQFEHTFFQLLGTFNNVLADVAFHYMDRRTQSGPDGTTVEDYATSAKGRAAFSYFWTRILAANYQLLPGGTHKEKVLQTADRFYEAGREELGQYFRTLYHIFKFVDQAPLLFKDRVQYANIARAQLSSLELSIVFYNGVVREGLAGFKPLIEKYGVLKHIESKYLLGTHVGEDDTQLFYDQTAFMNFSARMARWNSVEPTLTYD